MIKCQILILYQKVFCFDLTQISKYSLILNDYINSIKSEESNDYFIIKPIFRSQGKSISIINSLDANIFVNKMKKAKNSFGHNKFIISKYAMEGNLI